MAEHPTLCPAREKSVQSWQKKFQIRKSRYESYLNLDLNFQIDRTSLELSQNSISGHDQSIKMKPGCSSFAEIDHNIIHVCM